jgi:hypothetical protein
VSEGPQIGAPVLPSERNWVPLAVAAGVVLIVAAAVFFIFEHGRRDAGPTPINAALDPYAASLPLTNLAMSESTNLANGKVTYLDGHIANKGGKTVSAVTVQVLFHSYTHEVAENQTQSLKLIRMREPYVDVEPVSAAPIKAGGEADFRLIFDSAISPDWDGAYPEIRILHVEAR